MAIRPTFSTTTRTASESFADLGDDHLLALFAKGGISAEDAFTTLVERHGPMVLRVGRSLLRNEDEAQDLFQSTFLILARKARGLWVGDSLGPWLHGVACRVASDARKALVRRHTLERKVRAMGPSEPLVLEESEDGGETAAALHEEIAKLPERHRVAVVLCDLQGRSHAEAAQVLGCPIGTVKSRQARAREQLRRRLARRGLALTSVMVASLLADEGKAAVAAPPAVTRSTVRAALRFSLAGAPAVAGIVTPKVLGQVSRATLGMTEVWLKSISGVVLLVAATSVLAWRAVEAPQGGGTMTSKPAQRNSAPKGSLAGLRWEPERIDAWDPETTDREHAPFHSVVRRAKARATKKLPEPPAATENRRQGIPADSQRSPLTSSSTTESTARRAAMIPRRSR